MGKMRITERIGGFFRPKLSEEVSFTVISNFISRFAPNGCLSFWLRYMKASHETHFCLVLRIMLFGQQQHEVRYR